MNKQRLKQFFWSARRWAAWWFFSGCCLSAALFAWMSLALGNDTGLTNHLSPLWLRCSIGIDLALVAVCFAAPFGKKVECFVRRTIWWLILVSEMRLLYSLWHLDTYSSQYRYDPQSVGDFIGHVIAVVSTQAATYGSHVAGACVAIIWATSLIYTALPKDRVLLMRGKLAKPI